MARKAKRDLTIEQQLARGPIDLPFLALVMLLTAIGLIMVLSASYASAMYNLTPNVTNTGGGPAVLFQTAVWLCPAGAGSHGGDLQNRLPALPLDVRFRAGGVHCADAAGVCARLWTVRRRRPALVNIFGIRFQPSEIAKVGVIMFFSAGLSKRSSQLGPPKSGASAPSRAGWRRGWTASACWS